MTHDISGIDITTSTNIEKGKTAVFIKFMVDDLSEAEQERMKVAIAKELWPSLAEWVHLPQ